MDEQHEEVDERPWEQAGVLPRDCEPQRGKGLVWIATLGLLLGFFVIGIPVAVSVLVMTWKDLSKMADRTMDPAGQTDTVTAKILAYVTLLIGTLSLFIWIGVVSR